MFTYVAENIGQAPAMPGRPGIPTVRATSAQTENARVVLRHCETRLADLAGQLPAQVPPRTAAVQAAFQAGRVHAATVHRHLAEALDRVIGLESTPLPAPEDLDGAERERRLGYQVLCVLSEAQNTAVTAGEELVVLSARLPPAEPGPARPGRARAASAAPPASGPAPATTARHR
ncbi:hypothetical protein [Kitasatospora sp. NPDC098663]|uniref:hypothetical protein n=1 Tax=Kitasatospora sp. NPDC098663 TaxID=3364096 RepID=UPI00380318E5